MSEPMKSVTVRLDDDARKHLTRVTNASDYVRALLDNANRELDDAITFIGRMHEDKHDISGESIAVVIDTIARSSVYETGIVAPAIVCGRTVASSTVALQQQIDASQNIALALLVLARQIARGDARARLFVEGLRKQTKKEGKKK